MRGWVSEACDILFFGIVIALLSWLGTSTPRADELFNDEAIRGVLGSDACPADSQIEGPPQALGLTAESERDLFRLKRIAGGDLRGEFCLVESLRQLVGASQSASALFRRDNGPWRKVEEGYAMEVLETRTNGYPDISLPYWPPGKPRADRIWRAHAWDGQKYQPKHGPPSSLSGLSRYDGYNGVVSDGADAFFVVGATETGRQGESVGFLRLVRGALDIDFGAAPPNVTSSAYVDVIRLSDGDVVIVGWQRAVGALADDCAVMRASPEGQVRWRQVLGGASHERCYFISELPSGELFVGGRTEPSISGKDTASGAVWRLNARTGSPAPSGAATIRAAGVNRSAFQDAALVADGSIIFVGWATAPDRSDDDIWLVKQDPAGRFVWEQRIGDEGADLATSVMINADGDAIVVGYRTKKGAASTSGLVMTVSTDGKLGWVREFDVGPTGNDKFFHSALLPDGSLMAVGAASTDAKAPSVGWMVHLDQAGKLLKESLIEEPPGGRLNGVARLRGGGVVAVGSARDVARSDVDGWIVELQEPASQPVAAAPTKTSQPVVADGESEKTASLNSKELRELVTELDKLSDALNRKRDSDLDDVASAFWAMHSVENARWIADLAGAPLSVIEQAIAALSTAVSLGNLGQSNLETYNAWMGATAYALGLGQLERAGQNLQLAWDGPAYSAAIKSMYEKAAKAKNEKQFLGIIRNIVIQSTQVRTPDIVRQRGGPPNTSGSITVGDAVDALKRDMGSAGNKLILGATEQALKHLKDARLALLRSNQGNLDVATGDGKIVFGAIAELRKWHGRLLSQYSDDTANEMINVGVDAFKSGEKLALLQLSISGGIRPTIVQSSVMTVDNLAWSGVKQSFRTDVRTLVAEVPQQMVIGIGAEFSNALHIAETAIAAVRREVLPADLREEWPITISPGGEARGFKLSRDGKAYFNGNPLFPGMIRDVDSAQLRVGKPTLRNHYVYVVYYDGDWGGLQGAIVSYSQGRVLVGAIPEAWQVRGIGEPKNIMQIWEGISWSPNDKRAITQMDGGDGVIIGAIDVNNGRYDLIKFSQEAGLPGMMHYIEYDNPDAVVWKSDEIVTVRVGVSCPSEFDVDYKCDSSKAIPYYLTLDLAKKVPVSWSRDRITN